MVEVIFKILIALVIFTSIVKGAAVLTWQIMK